MGEEGGDEAGERGVERGCAGAGVGSGGPVVLRSQCQPAQLAG